VDETPKPGDPRLARVDNRIIGSNRLALDAAATAARSCGYHLEILSDTVNGEARQAAHWLAEQGRVARKRGGRQCLLAGGETTVTVQGNGKGGRNQELALAFALEIYGEKRLALLSAGTDGTDGPTDAAGAFADGRTVPAARQKGLDAERFLADNDSYTFFASAGGLLRTGPTGTNVMDLQILLIEGSPCNV
jgi:glycerate-2-kinase